MVPYRGAGQSSADLVAGNIDVLLDTPALSLQQHRAGNVKAFAVANNKRLATAPDIPTTDEAGLPGFYFTFWHALWAPKGTPKEIVAKLNEAAVKALEDPTIKARLADLSNEIFPARAADARRRSPRSTAPRSRNGGRSSRRPTSRRSDASCSRRRAARLCSHLIARRSPFVASRQFRSPCRSRRR